MASVATALRQPQQSCSCTAGVLQPCRWTVFKLNATHAAEAWQRSINHKELPGLTQLQIRNACNHSVSLKGFQPMAANLCCFAAAATAATVQVGLW
jgi:hypothetical protein